VYKSQSESDSSRGSDTRKASVWSEEDRNPMRVGSTRKRQADPQVL
jgi:hypothetical protein